MADIISRLKLESGEFDSKIKRAAQGINQMVAEARKMNSTLISAAGNTEEEVKANMKYIQSLGRMETVSQTARGKLAELTAGFTDLRHAYNQLSQEEKSGNVGRELNKQLEILKQRIAESKNEIKGIEQELNGSNSKFGEFGNIIDTIGSKFGVSGNLTEMLTSKTAMLTGAVGAGIAIVTKATEAWAGYNAELAKQDQITTVTTGLKGEDANKMTDFARSLVDTYNVDFREAINAANTLMTQFGQTGDEAIQLLRDGMQGMIQGDGPKLLQMIQQYAPAFRDAGVSASQLVAVIQNSEGGIFTDQNMNAIVMGIKNIRLMTKPTSDALAQLGIDGQKMSQQLSDGSLTIFDALKQVATAIQGVDSNSKAAGEVMQQVFGRQGAMAGTKLGEAIATLNTNLEETKKQTGKVGQSFDDLYEANLRLNTAIRDAFGYDGWEQMATGIKTTLIGALSDVIEHLAIIREGFNDIANFFGGGNKAPTGKGYEDVEKTQQWINNGKDDNERRRRYDKAIADLQKKLNNVGKERAVRNSDGSTSYVIDDEETQAKKRAALQKRMSMLYATSYTEETKIKPNKPIPGSGGGKNTITEEKGDFTEIIGLIGNAQERVSDLQRQIRESWDQNETVNLRKKLKDAQNELDVLQGKLPKDTVVDITVDANTAEALQKIGNIKGVTIAPKTVEINATDEAMPKLRDIEGVTIDPKTSVITATDEAMPKLRDIEGVTIEPKNMTVTADTTEALQRVQELIAQVNGTVVGIKVEPIKVEPGSLKAYQEQLKESQSDLQVMREDLLRLKEAGAEPMEIAVKEDEIQDAIDNISTIEKKIDDLTGKSANISINIGDEAGSFDIGESMMEKLRDEIAASAENADMSTITEFIKQGIENGVDSADMTSIGQKLIQRMTNGDDIDPSDMEDFLATMKEKLQGFIDEEEWPKIELAVKTGDLTAIQEFIKRVQVASKTAEDGWKHAASAISTLGSALNQIEDPMAKVVGTIAMAVAQVAEAAGKAINAPDTTSSGWAWIGAAAAITATMVSTIATIHSATKFADGGIVPGSTMSGDQIPALLNAQEVVLNHAQVGNLAAQLEGGGSQGGQPNVRIEGEDLWITLNNYTQRSGYGEIVTSK